MQRKYRGALYSNLKKLERRLLLYSNIKRLQRALSLSLSLSISLSPSLYVSLCLSMSLYVFLSLSILYIWDKELLSILVIWERELSLYSLYIRVERDRGTYREKERERESALCSLFMFEYKSSLLSSLFKLEYRAPLYVLCIKELLYILDILERENYPFIIFILE